MATAQPSTSSTSREKGSSSNCLLRSPADSEKALVRDEGSIKSAEENRGPPTLPKSFQGMLKTTTETGDIGLFSIKPSRVPQPVSNPHQISGPYNDDGMQQPRQFQPYGVPNIDDRRRLPSYARDTSSEVISMYESASQKSANRVFDDPDYRSYSMTQTYSSYSLSNHRSYASLRSQPDACGGGLLQRPRSPFAYPTRLKRPGFRPSSPALTDGGAIDHSRRAEIDRPPHGANHHTSSPASLYAQRRKLPILLRPEANRSTPSLLSQSSPQRRSPSPNMQRRSETPNNDWRRRNGPTSVTSSPARSTFSLASTVNLYQTALAGSTTTTPGRIPPPSPLYYDYTEDFDVDDFNQPEPLEPPPQFRIEKTIPEDRPLSSGWSPLDGSDQRAQKSSFNTGLRNLSFVNSVVQKSLEYSQDSSMKSHSTNVFGKIQRNSINENETVIPADNCSEVGTINPRDTKVIRLSGLGLGARELSTHVEEAFGLLASPSFEILVFNDMGDEGKSVDENAIQERDDIESVRTSAYSLNTHLCKFPPPPQPRNLDGHYSELDADRAISSEASAGLPPLPQDSLDPSKSPAGNTEQMIGNEKSPLSLLSSSRQSDRKRLSCPSSIDDGRTELDELVSVFQDVAGTKNLEENRAIQDTIKVSPVVLSNLHNGSPFGNTSLSQRFNDPPSFFNESSSEKCRKGMFEQGLKRSRHRHEPPRLEPITIPVISENDVPNFSHQFPRKLLSRSESPILAPKPISPARQLKLKNSVPQLMKALPPLPLDLPICAVPPPTQLAVAETELPCRFSPLMLESRAISPLEPLRLAEIPNSPDIGRVMSVGKVFEPLGQDSVTLNVVVAEKNEEEQKAVIPSTSKLKLKMRSSSTLRPTSPLGSRPWNSEDSYPWSSQNFNIGLPAVVPEEKITYPKPPKFKLKITRASNSTVGTVRINRGSGDFKPSSGLHLRHPKDLFTPTTGIDNIFRQVSRHLHSRKMSISSSHHIQERNLEPISSSISNENSLSCSCSSDSISPHPSPTSLSAASPTEVRSFFSDDSSRRYNGGHGLRKRLSNLRARIAVPYEAANRTQSHDDVSWRSRNGPDAPVPPAAEARHPRRVMERIHAHKLRSKFTLWFNGAKSAIQACVKSQKGAGRGDEQ